MSNKVININEPWKRATEGLLAALDTLSWEKTSSLHQSDGLRIYSLENAPSAFDIEWQNFWWLRSQIEAGSTISAQHLAAIISNYHEIESKYKTVDAACYDEFKTRQTTVFDTITHNNKLIKNRATPPLTLNHSNEIQRHNAKVTLESLIWDNTDKNATKSTSIRSGSVMEKSIVNKLAGRIERGKSFDTSTYAAIIMHLRGIHKKYQIFPAVEAEFAVRQTQLKLAMKILYRHHKDSNLFTNEDLEHAKQHKLTNQQHHDDTTEPDKTTKSATNILAFERPAPLPS